MHIEVARDLPAQIHALSVLSSCTPNQSRHFVFVADPTLLNWPQGARGPAMALRPHPPGADPDPDPRDLLTALVTDGPERGIHVLSFFEGLAKVQPMLGREFPSHFAFKVTGRIDEYEARISLGDASVTALRPGQFIVRDELSTEDAVQFQGFSPSQPPENPSRLFDK